MYKSVYGCQESGEVVVLKTEKVIVKAVYDAFGTLTVIGFTKVHRASVWQPIGSVD
jgi:hypothetical protein